MKAVYVSLALAGLVAAQDLSGLPDCIKPCIKDAIPDLNCSGDLNECLCDHQQDLVAKIGPCALSKCSAEDAVKAQTQAGEKCKNKGGSGSMTGSMSAPTGSSTESATESSSATETESATESMTQSSVMPTMTAPSNGTIPGNGTTTITSGTGPKPTASSGGSGTQSGTGPQSSKPADNSAAGPVAGALIALFAAVAAL